MEFWIVQNHLKVLQQIHQQNQRQHLAPQIQIKGEKYGTKKDTNTIIEGQT